MTTVLVVGASGYAGRYIVTELAARGHSVRAVVRDRGRAEASGPHGSPGLDGRVVEWVVGDVTDPAFTRDIAAGADRTISALGVTRQGNDPWEIDNLANLNVLNSVLAHGGRSFTYVHALGADDCPAQLTRAKSAFAQTLATAEVVAQIIRPSGYFSDMLEMLAMARRGLVTVLDRRVRVNPIHGADLATFIVDRMESGVGGSWDVGGPEIFSWPELAEVAGEAAGRSPRTVRIPRMLLEPALRLMALVNPQAADTVRFMTWNMAHDCVGETMGEHRLADFYAGF